jgi:hypothetical protein
MTLSVVTCCQQHPGKTTNAVLIGRAILRPNKIEETRSDETNSFYEQLLQLRVTE